MTCECENCGAYRRLPTVSERLEGRALQRAAAQEAVRLHAAIDAYFSHGYASQQARERTLLRAIHPKDVS